MCSSKLRRHLNEIDFFVDTHVRKLCVALRSHVLRGVWHREGLYIRRFRSTAACIGSLLPYPCERQQTWLVIWLSLVERLHSSSIGNTFTTINSSILLSPLKKETWWKEVRCGRRVQIPRGTGRFRLMIVFMIALDHGNTSLVDLYQRKVRAAKSQRCRERAIAGIDECVDTKQPVLAGMAACRCARGCKALDRYPGCDTASRETCCCFGVLIELHAVALSP